MLKVVIPAREQYDNSTGLFTNVKEHTLQLEHSLVSLAKWESIFCKPFLSQQHMTTKEIVEYIKCMTITQNVDPNVYSVIPRSVLKQIQEYIAMPMTATTISREASSGDKEIVTAEVIYYQMITLGIPVEFQKWHLNRLLTLISVCVEKNKPPQKMSNSELISRNRAINAARRAKHRTRG